MDLHLITAFPEMVKSPLENSILKRAVDKKLVDYHIHNLRDFAQGKHRQIDDYPYGGGPGMVLKPEPIITCVESILEKYTNDATKIILLTPQGVTYRQKKAHELKQYEQLIFICGHYKGIDERVIEYLAPDLISIGNFVLSNGEIPALAIIDSVVRLIPGVLSDFDSAAFDSFESDLMDYPHYTRPPVFRDLAIPEVLLSGNHAQIEAWRKQKAIEKTDIKRQNELKEDGFE